MAQYVEVPLERFDEMMVRAGFARLQPWVGSKEICYERRHNHDPRWRIRVYSGYGLGGEQRGCGADAIRCCLLLVTNKKVYPMGKVSRVYRAGTIEGVLERTLERCRDLYRMANQRIRADIEKGRAPKAQDLAEIEAGEREVAEIEGGQI